MSSFEQQKRQYAFAKREGKAWRDRLRFVLPDGRLVATIPSSNVNHGVEDAFFRIIEKQGSIENDKFVDVMRSAISSEKLTPTDKKRFHRWVDAQDACEKIQCYESLSKRARRVAKIYRDGVTHLLAMEDLYLLCSPHVYCMPDHLDDRAISDALVFLRNIDSYVRAPNGRYAHTPPVEVFRNHTHVVDVMSYLDLREPFQKIKWYARHKGKKDDEWYTDILDVEVTVHKGTRLGVNHYHVEKEYTTRLVEQDRVYDFRLPRHFSLGRSLLTGTDVVSMGDKCNRYWNGEVQKFALCMQQLHMTPFVSGGSGLEALISAVEHDRRFTTLAYSVTYPENAQRIPVRQHSGKSPVSVTGRN